MRSAFWRIPLDGRLYFGILGCGVCYGRQLIEFVGEAFQTSDDLSSFDEVLNYRHLDNRGVISCRKYDLIVFDSVACCTLVWLPNVSNLASWRGLMVWTNAVA